MNEVEAEIAACAARLGLTLKSEFVPFSKSRNAKEKLPSLNWRVTLQRNGRDVLTTDYMAGSGHCPSYQVRQTVFVAEAVKAECESGRRFNERMGVTLGARIEPRTADVLASLVRDGAAIDCATFEDWANECGYDLDSRKGEAIYRACVEIGLKLRAALGENGLQELREACQEW